jgi:hypothetical protein
METTTNTTLTPTLTTNTNAIEKIIIENFQSHQKTVVEPAPAGQLTVLVGNGDAGKSVVLRVLKWIFYNSPQGMDFVRVGANYVKGALEYGSGHKIIRGRTVSTNRYTVVSPESNNPEVYEGFGNSIPLEIQQITGVYPVKIGDDVHYLNLLEQSDGPFLGTKQISSPARAKVLGKMAGTEEIDVAGQELGTDLYRRNQDEKRLKTEIAGLGEDIKRFDYLPRLKAKIEQLQGVLEAVKAAQERKTKLENIRFSLTTVNQNIEQCNLVVERWRDLDTIARIMAEVESMKQRRDNLVALRQQKETAEVGMRGAEAVIARLVYLPETEDMVVIVETLSQRLNWLKQLKTNFNNASLSLSHAEICLSKWARVDEAEQARNGVIELTEKRRILIGLRQQLQTIEQNITTTRQNAVVWEQRVAELEGAYKDALLAAGVCPTCGTEMTLEKLKNVV